MYKLTVIRVVAETTSATPLP